MMEEQLVIKKVLEASGFGELNPVQQLAVSKGLLKGKNMVVASPTASGKTLLAELLGVMAVAKGKKMVYLCPLVALASEKYESFKKKYADKGISVALSVGDFDSSDPFLASYDWIVASNEKMDSLLRHGAEWVSKVGALVIDEVHLINDVSRGPTLEVLVARLRQKVKNLQILALSATIKNAREIAEWLDAELVVSDWRPVELHEGVAYDSIIKFYTKPSIPLEKSERIEDALVKNVLERGKQILFFISTRRNAESLAERLAKIVGPKLDGHEVKLLKELSEEIENVLEVPTKQCKKLASCVQKGVAFHHAGLVGKQRRLVEENFRKGLIKVICATPTLAAGVNLPSFMVVVRDAKRYVPGFGAHYLPVLEVKQMFGRAGRPDYDEYGEAVIIAKNEDEAEELAMRYVFGEPEEIYSKLSVRPVLRSHVLAYFAIEEVSSFESLVDFFSATFYAYQYGNNLDFVETLREVTEELAEWGFIKQKNGKVYITRLGKRVSELYIDPLTAKKFLDGLEIAKTKYKLTVLSLLELLCEGVEAKPLLPFRNSEFYDLAELVDKHSEEFLVEVPEEWEPGYEEFLQKVKTAAMLIDWMEEKSEDELMKSYGITPGELRSKLNNFDWLLYSLHELALLKGMKEFLPIIRKVRLRLRHGVKEELLSLVKLKGIGRVRARKLYNHGIKKLSDVKKVPYETLAFLLGPKIAKKVKEQVEGIGQEEQRSLLELEDW